MSRRLLAVLAGLLLVVLAGGGVATALHHREEEREERASACPDGFRRLSAEYLRELRSGTSGREEASEEAEHGEEAEGSEGSEAAEGSESEEEREREGGEGKGVCLRDSVKAPEPYADITKATDAADSRFSIETPGAYARAARQAASLRSAVGTVPGTNGTWTPVGSGPLIFDDPRYPDNFGLSRAAGRISDYAYDTGHGRLFASVANGGVWLTTDRGAHWRSIGDTLPTQIVGALSWTSAGGADGTLVALTGDNAFGGNTYGGMGAYWSDDLGATWHKASGAPDGAQGFRVAVQPGSPATEYAATGFGLYRTTDAGHSWANVELPTGACAGVVAQQPCFLANVVTDVQVNDKGEVVSAVGWRAGPKANTDGSKQAPYNGIYTSSTGAVGSFAKTGSGFLAGADVGRVALGAATGASQDHEYVYALAQNSNLFNTGKLEGLDIGDGDPLGLGVDPTATPTYVEGVFVSADFGRTWTQVVTRQQLLSPTTGSTLAQLSALGFGPGIQSWYNEWVRPEPTQQTASGVPTRLSFGLEEVYETTNALTGVKGPSNPTAVGPYSAFGGGCILTLTGGACGSVAQASGLNTLHPDQHAAAYVPNASGGGTTLFAGNDGGAYSQATPSALGTPMTPSGFGKGIDEGFNTLLPYGLSAAKDGTIFAGLQDNGTEKIDPAEGGKQYETYGGDGTYALVDPDDSKQALAATPNGGLVVTHTGGAKPSDDPTASAYTDVAPTDGLKDPQFLTPFTFDDTTSGRIGLAARNVLIADTKLAGLTSDSWKGVYDLGTAKHPGDTDAVASDTPGDIDNVATAMALHGGTSYVGYCGSCDPVVNNVRFANGIATDVGGTWHLAKHAGLPERIINHVAVDPADPRTVYVALGESTSRPYAPAGALGDDGVQAGGGHVYKSTDGGETFTDISGDLPSTGATWLIVRGDQLLAATTVGVFASKDKQGSAWAPLSTGLPAAPVFSMTMDPANANRLLVASYGRGIYAYDFTDRPGAGTGGGGGGAGTGTTPGGTTTPGGGTSGTPGGSGTGSGGTGSGTGGGAGSSSGGGAAGTGAGGSTSGTTCRDPAPTSRFDSRRSTVRAGRRLVLRGTARDAGCRARVTRVSVSVARAVGKRCRYLQANGRFGAPSSCLRTRYLTARGTSRWSFTTRRVLPAGHYKLWVRAVDAGRNVEHKRFSRNGLKVTAAAR